MKHGKFLLIQITGVILLTLATISCNDTKTTNSKIGNALVKETSPYLLQHAYNPVHWRAWNNETLTLAKKENKLMIISIGYSACHWCHVMEEESFENDTIAKLMNENFINVKVDREERPDIDKVYMNAVQLMTGGGGWPLNCITLPDGRPIFGGTYFTKAQWEKILIDISKLYTENPEKAIRFAERLTEGLQASNLIEINSEKASFKKEDIHNAMHASKKIRDTLYGGIQGAPKFPMPNSLDFLLRYQHQFDDKEIRKYVDNTLTKMAFGGLYDHIGGGFSRYSIDEKWHIPHFEKMLYDNAQLVSIYAKAYLESKNELYKKVVTETLAFIDKELNAKNGAFYASLDADSKNNNNQLEEGAYYAWNELELKNLLKEEFPLFQDYFNINDFGFWEKENYVLIRSQSNTDFAKKHGLKITDLNTKINHWKELLLEERKQRNKPNLDDKILTSWNALMLQGYVDAYRAFGDENYRQKAIHIAGFLLEKQLKSDGSLHRSFKNGKSSITGYSEDYATVISALLSLYEITLNDKYLDASKNLMEYTIENFYDTSSAMFFYTSNRDNNLITRKIEIIDGVINSSNSILANSLFKLGHYYYDTKMIERSKQMLNNLKTAIIESPLNYSNWLHLMTNFTNPYYEVAIVGAAADAVNKELGTHYLPNILITGAKKDSEQPLLKNKYVPGNTFIYVCVNGTCKLPQSDLKKAMRSIKK